VKIAIVTSTENPHPDPDEPALLAALAARGAQAEVRAWDDPSVDWGATDLAVIRSTWNYVHHHEEFVAWAAARTNLWNPPDVVRWNSHKKYLLELEARGVPIVPTTLVPEGATIRIEPEHAVVKPAVSAGAYRTFRAVRGDVVEADRDLLVQPYVAAVETSGERAIIVIDGEITHAIRKEPFGISTNVPRVEVAPDEAALARRVLDAIGSDTLYARVDLIRDEGVLRLMELEVIEPFLFFHLAPEACGKLADAIVRRAR
jgi:glutathione synthase/RimK-type ligase-like ATP-grasp enzyme